MSYGWCQSCCDRIGRKNFRALFNGQCAECVKKFGLPKSQSTGKQLKQSRIVKKETSIEEKILLDWISRNTIYTYWKKNAAKDLQWDLNQVNKIARKLRSKKLFTSSSISLSEKILDFLDNPKTVYQLAEELPFKTSWINQVLVKLANEGKVLIINPSDPKKPNIYLLKKDAIA